MKLGKDVLLEIVDIVRRGLAEAADVSELLRELDLEDIQVNESYVLKLSDKYLADKGRVQEA